MDREITRLDDDDELAAVPVDTAESPEAVARAALILAELPDLYRRIL